MDFIGQYSEWIRERWKFPLTEKTYAIATLGLAGESGEVVDLIKKQFRGDVIPDFQEKLKLELGDALHYLLVIARHNGIPIHDVIAANVDKLIQRDKERPGWTTKERQI